MASARPSRDPAALGVVLALVVGKAVGVLGGTWGFARFTRAELDDDLAWTDVLGLSLLAGIGFTVSLLIGGLAFGAGSARDEHVKVAVLVGSLAAAALAAVVLRLRNRVYRADRAGGAARRGRRRRARTASQPEPEPAAAVAGRRSDRAADDAHG